MVAALQSGLSWEAFLESTWWVTQLHIRAYVKQYESWMQLAAWHAHHNYAAMCGGANAPSVDDLLGRRHKIADLNDDPFALDALADEE